MFWHGLTRTRPNQDDLATDDPYQFQPLSASTTIRLIKVVRKKVNGCIACKIFHFNEKQQEAIKYHALSYVWGDPKPTRQIYLQDQGNEWHPFQLHENLWHFLDHTWRTKGFNQLFWTDYICLNQKDPEEISQQVPRMNAIYRNAELVVIWLHFDPEEHDPKALRKVMRWGNCLKLMPKVMHRQIQERLFKYTYTVLYAMRNPYWKRIWIVQEVVVARKVCVTSEDIRITLDDLRVLADLYVKFMGDWGQRPSMWLLCNMRAAGGRIPLWRILKDFVEYQSSRRVDRVFGMLGMVEDNEDGTSPVENIRVDYNRSLSQVLLDAVFESSPPLTEYMVMIRCIGEFPQGSLVLEDYIRLETMERHRDFAEIALQAFEAFSIIMWVPSAPDHHTMSEWMDGLFSAAAGTGWRPTLRQNAALIGLMLSSWGWGGTPRRILDGQRVDGGHLVSPWRCAAHGSHDEGHAGLGSYKMVADVLAWGWDRGSIVNVCGQQSESCKGSVIACEISRSGLRLRVEPGVSRADASRVSLYCLKGDLKGRSQIEQRAAE